jgi:hypothetical protein
MMFEQRFFDPSTMAQNVVLQWDAESTVLYVQLASGALPAITDLTMLDGDGLRTRSTSGQEITVRLDRADGGAEFVVTVDGMTQRGSEVDDAKSLPPVNAPAPAPYIDPLTALLGQSSTAPAPSASPSSPGFGWPASPESSDGALAGVGSEELMRVGAPTDTSTELYGDEAPSKKKRFGKKKDVDVSVDGVLAMSGHSGEPAGKSKKPLIIIGAAACVGVVFVGMMVARTSVEGNKIKTSFDNITNTLPGDDVALPADPEADPFVTPIDSAASDGTTETPEAIAQEEAEALALVDTPAGDRDTEVAAAFASFTSWDDSTNTCIARATQSSIDRELLATNPRIVFEYQGSLINLRDALRVCSNAAEVGRVVETVFAAGTFSSGEPVSQCWIDWVESNGSYTAVAAKFLYGTDTLIPAEVIASCTPAA